MKRLPFIILLVTLVPGPSTAIDAPVPEFPEFTIDSAQEYLRAVAPIAEGEDLPSPELVLVTARIESQLGRQDVAEDLARKALTQDSSQPEEIHAFLGELLVRQDRFEDAAIHLRRAVEIKPEVGGGWRRLGMVLDQLGEREEARRAYEKATQYTPNDGQAWFLLGRWLLDNGHVEKAVQHLIKACELNPQSVSAYYILSRARGRLGDSEGARRALRTFQDLKRQESGEAAAKDRREQELKTRAMVAAFHLELSRLSRDNGEFRIAESHLRQAAQVASEEPAVHETLAAYYMTRRRLESARAACETLVHLRPDNPVYRLNFGALLLRLNDRTAAVDQLLTAIELDPDQPQALNNLARLFLGTGRDVTRALDWSRHLVSIEPTAANYDLLAWAYYANGQLKEARAASAKSIELDPANPVFQERLRRLNSVKGRRTAGDEE